jgi:hypothetical protein
MQSVFWTIDASSLTWFVWPGLRIASFSMAIQVTYSDAVADTYAEWRG